MPDVYQRNIGSASAMAADAAKLTFSGASGLVGVGMLAQTISINYTQQITKVFELGSNNILYIAGRTQGQVQMARIVGPRAIHGAFYRTYGNVCNVQQNNFTLELVPGCQAVGDSGNNSIYRIKQSVIASLGLQVNAQDTVVNESVQMMFGSLELN